MAAVFKDDYHIHLTSRPKWLALNLKEVWDYRDLVFLLARRTFTVSYKQTILGPLWIIITPFISALGAKNRSIRMPIAMTSRSFVNMDRI